MTEGTIAAVTIASDEFVLGRTLTTVEGLTVEVERVVAHNDDHVMPFVWMRNVDHDATEAVLADDPSVERIELLADLGTEWLCRMEWVERIDTFLQILVERGTILAATGNEEEWNLRVLFPDRAALSQTYDYCQERGLSLGIRKMCQLEDSRQDRFGLTNGQREILTLASKHGYYSVPREVNAATLADVVGVSHQAISERLRRAHGNLVENALRPD